MFDRIVVSTEDSEIAHLSKEAGADVCERAPELADSHAKVRDVVHSVSQTLTCDFICIVYPTAVFLKPESLTLSFAEFDNRPYPDFVLGVCRMSPHPWKAMRIASGFGEPVFSEKIDLKGQQQCPFFASTGTFHWARRSVLLRNGNYWQQRRRLFELSRLQAIDIDEVEDLELARAVKDWELRTGSFNK